MRSALFIMLGLVGGCTGASPTFCEHHPEAAECTRSDAGTPCTTDEQCMGDKPACDTGAMVCVICTSTSTTACTGTTPVCSTDEACRACASNAECASEACLPDGSCGDDSNVAYVDAAGTANAMCTKAAPCSKVTNALATGRPFVKIHGTIDESVTISGGTVTLFGDPGAQLTHPGTAEPLLQIMGAPNVSILDLEITRSSSTFPGILVPSGASPHLSLTRVTLDANAAQGVDFEGGTLAIDSSTVGANGDDGLFIQNATANITNTRISQNTRVGLDANVADVSVGRSTFKSNAEGGILLQSSGSFVIVGNVFAGNGGVGSSTGGVHITIPASAGDRLDFNSFAGNRSKGAASGFGPAIRCDIATLMAENNVMSGNTGSDASPSQISGTCTHAYSIVHGGTVPAGTGNSGSDPLFLDEVGGDLHVQSTSPARGAADPTSDLSGVAALDIDGDARVSPADIGADQIPH